MSVLLDSTLKVSVIVLMALCAVVVLRRRSAAVRHWVLSVAITCAVAAPVLSLVAPSWHLGFSMLSPAQKMERSGRVINTSTVFEEPSAGNDAPNATTLARRWLILPGLLGSI